MKKKCYLLVITAIFLQPALMFSAEEEGRGLEVNKELTDNDIANANREIAKKQEELDLVDKKLKELSKQETTKITTSSGANIPAINESLAAERKSLEDQKTTLTNGIEKIQDAIKTYNEALANSVVLNPPSRELTEVSPPGLQDDKMNVSFGATDANVSYVANKNEANILESRIKASSDRITAIDSGITKLKDKLEIDRRALEEKIKIESKSKNKSKSKKGPETQSSNDLNESITGEINQLGDLEKEKDIIAGKIKIANQALDQFKIVDAINTLKKISKQKTNEHVIINAINEAADGIQDQISAALKSSNNALKTIALKAQLALINTFETAVKPFAALYDSIKSPPKIERAMAQRYKENALNLFTKLFNDYTEAFEDLKGSFRVQGQLRPDQLYEAIGIDVKHAITQKDIDRAIGFLDKRANNSTATENDKRLAQLARSILLNPIARETYDAFCTDYKSAQGVLYTNNATAYSDVYKIGLTKATVEKFNEILGGTINLLGESKDPGASAAKNFMKNSATGRIELTDRTKQDEYKKQWQVNSKDKTIPGLADVAILSSGEQSGILGRLAEMKKNIETELKNITSGTPPPPI